jgi:hypothetical protein
MLTWVCMHSHEPKMLTPACNMLPGSSNSETGSSSKSSETPLYACLFLCVFASVQYVYRHISVYVKVWCIFACIRVHIFVGGSAQVMMLDVAPRPKVMVYFDACAFIFHLHIRARNRYGIVYQCVWLVCACVRVYMYVCMNVYINNQVDWWTLVCFMA